jgi:hypothetical protein
MFNVLLIPLEFSTYVSLQGQFFLIYLCDRYIFFSMQMSYKFVERFPLLLFPTFLLIRIEYIITMFNFSYSYLNLFYLIA